MVVDELYNYKNRFWFRGVLFLGLYQGAILNPTQMSFLSERRCIQAGTLTNQPGHYEVVRIPIVKQ